MVDGKTDCERTAATAAADGLAADGGGMVTYFNGGEGCCYCFVEAVGMARDERCRRCGLGREWCSRAFGSSHAECNGGYLEQCR